MLNTMKEEFPEGIEYTNPEGGLFTWVELPKHLDSRSYNARVLKE